MIYKGKSCPNVCIRLYIKGLDQTKEFDYAALIDDTYFNKSVNHHHVRSVVTDVYNKNKKKKVKWG